MRAKIGWLKIRIISRNWVTFLTADYCSSELVQKKLSSSHQMVTFSRYYSWKIACSALHINNSLSHLSKNHFKSNEIAIVIYHKNCYTPIKRLATVSIDGVVFHKFVENIICMNRCFNIYSWITVNKYS